MDRFKQTLCREVAKQCIDGQLAWNEKLPALLMVYRSAADETTGYSLTKLMFRRELRLPVALLTGKPPGDGFSTDALVFARELENSWRRFTTWSEVS